MRFLLALPLDCTRSRKPGHPHQVYMRPPRTIQVKIMELIIIRTD
jgi:hypothetical protein